MQPTPEVAHQRLTDKHNIWIATVRPDGRPHLVPVWFIWHTDRLYIGIRSNSIKGLNLAQNANVSLALEDAGVDNVVICEGKAVPLPKPWPIEVLAKFKQKYDWSLLVDRGYDWLVEVTPHKWLTW